MSLAGFLGTFRERFKYREPGAVCSGLVHGERSQNILVWTGSFRMFTAGYNLGAFQLREASAFWHWTSRTLLEGPFRTFWEPFCLDGWNSRYSFGKVWSMNSYYFHLVKTAMTSLKRQSWNVYPNNQIIYSYCLMEIIAREIFYQQNNNNKFNHILLGTVMSVSVSEM